MENDEIAPDAAPFDPAAYGLPPGSPPPPAFSGVAPPARAKRIAQGLVAAVVALAMLATALYMLELFRASSTGQYAPRFAPNPSTK